MRSQNVVSVRQTSGLHDTKLSFLWLELTGQCNLACVHCYEESDPNLPLLGSMMTQDWIGVLNEATTLGLKDVQFIGGEPTLHPDIGLLIQTATRLGIQVEIYTNGTTIKDELWQILADNHVALAFSYYGVDAQVHDAVTTRRGSHTKTRASIKRAVDSGLNVRVGVIEIPGINDETLEATVAEIHELGVQKVGQDRMRGFGRGVVSLEAVRNPFKDLCGGCGGNKLAIDNNGNVHPCVFSKFTRLGHVSQGLNALANGGHMDGFLDRLHEEHPKRMPAHDRDPAKNVACWPGDCRPWCSPNCHPASCDPSERCHPDCSPGCYPNNKSC